MEIWKDAPISRDHNPTLDVDKLKGESGYRLRVGQYRIIYTLYEDQLMIEVVRIKPRGDIYKR
jgi:mRNA interferase RelE/StbE